jgi:hypothetical protein
MNEFRLPASPDLCTHFGFVAFFSSPSFSSSSSSSSSVQIPLETDATSCV